MSWLHLKEAWKYKRVFSKSISKCSRFHLDIDSDWCKKSWTAKCSIFQFCTKLEIISDQSNEGCQFVKGFGGIGGLLRYKFEIDSEHIHDYDDDADDIDLEDY
ncbi:hypothetical protein A3Q56_05857 [Intoshia linei]|uniref:eRF1 domain-containing protein n=1 Tax=Intoshia linei TaxID=1819745 RepID=A0A177AWQ4_9BILA|nr:hypothetical protein A3Q56_05857 [Intoshia linei]